MNTWRAQKTLILLWRVRCTSVYVWNVSPSHRSFRVPQDFKWSRNCRIKNVCEHEAFRPIKSSPVTAAYKATGIFSSIYRALNRTDVLQADVCAHHRILLFRAEPILPGPILIHSTVMPCALLRPIKSSAFEKVAKVNAIDAFEMQITVLWLSIQMANIFENNSSVERKLFRLPGKEIANKSFKIVA